jgi:arabinogalactan oligomer/maltooligosaccharide transport system permease protein
MSSPHSPARRGHSTTTRGMILRIIVLGVVLASVAFILPVMIGQQLWMWAVVTLLAAVAIFVLYSTKKFVPAKYLFPGTFFLAVFLIVPILLTVNYSFTNYGDGTRGTKDQAIASITGNSVQQSPDAPRYAMSVVTEGTPADGPFRLFLVNEKTGEVMSGADGERAEAVEASAVTQADGHVTAADGYEVLTTKQVNAAYDTIKNVAVEVDDTHAIRPMGVNLAFVGTKTLQYDEATDTITNSQTGETFTTGKVGNSDFFVDADGTKAFGQGWKQNVGTANYQRLVTDPSIGGQFLKAFGWTLVFALVSVLSTFLLGLFLALSLNDSRLHGQKIYRSILLMPYAIPGFISLLVWSNFYNKDFGLINETLHLHLDWFGDPTLAKVAVLLTNLWMGFPYMFIISTGALQSIPQELTEAARIDGASRLQVTGRVVTPLLLVSVAPLLVSSFAFNFNNFNAIQLLTGGGPFAAGEYVRGATDILISMIYRMAFAGHGADFGFASAVSVGLFLITGVLAAVQFRATRTLEDVN